MSRRRRIIESPELDIDEGHQDLEMMSTASSSCVPSSFDVSVSEMDVTSIASQDGASMGAPRTPRGWATKNKWAEHATTKEGKGILCLFPGCRKFYQTSSFTTSGVNRHLQSAHKINKESGVNDGSLSRSGPLDAHLYPSKQARIIHPTCFDDLLVRYIVRTKQPFSAVGSTELQELLNHCTMASMSQVKLPSSDTIARKVKEKYADATSQVTDLLSSVPKLALTADAWTGPSQKDFLGVTAHWIDDKWVQQELVIGFEPLEGAHTGQNLAEALVNVAERNLQGKLQHVPCLGHAINLAVQAIMGPNGLNDLAPETNDPYVDLDQGEADRPAQGMTALAKVRRGVVHIRASPQRMRRFDRICQSEDCKPLQLTRDVRTRWNSTYAMVERAIHLRNAYQSMCRNEVALKPYELQDDEWEYLDKLAKLLQQFDELTKKVSGSQYPTLNRAMSVYNKLIDQLEDVIANEEDPVLKQAAAQGRSKLLKYYAKTDCTPVYAVPTAMDPRMRYNWWNVQNWGEYVQTSIEAVNAVWEGQYKGKEGPQLLDTHVAKEMAMYGIEQQDGELE
ncbi:hypothetical protein KVV02_004693, partial [Mortierella alpina]